MPPVTSANMIPVSRCSSADPAVSYDIHDAGTSFNIAAVTNAPTTRPIIMGARHRTLCSREYRRSATIARTTRPSKPIVDNSPSRLFAERISS